MDQDFPFFFFWRNTRPNTSSLSHTIGSGAVRIATREAGMALTAERQPDSVFQLQGDKLFYNLDKLVEDGLIYEHQSLAVKAIRRDLTSEIPTKGDYDNVSLVVLPTGSGKTGVGVMAAYVCKAKRVLIVTPSAAISKQQTTQFKIVKDSHLNPLNNQPFLFERKIFDIEDYDRVVPRSLCVLETKELKNVQYDRYELVVANAHKFGKGSGRGVDIKVFPRDYFSLVIVDEAHHFPAETWKNIVDRFNKAERILFLTATPFNRDEYILPNKSPCYELSHEAAVTRGIIRETAFIEVEPSRVDQDSMTSPIILPVLRKVCETLKKHDDPRYTHAHKAMVLAKDKVNAWEIARLWKRHCAAEFGKCLTFIEKDSAENVNQFKKDRNTRVLVVIYRLTEGFDYKEVSVVAILRNVNKKSRVYFAQFVGRAVRKLRKDDPVFATVISSTHYNQSKNFEAFKNNVLPPDIREDPSLANEEDIESENEEDIEPE